MPEPFVDYTTKPSKHVVYSPEKIAEMVRVFNHKRLEKMFAEKEKATDAHS
jgi:hypothetical protein